MLPLSIIVALADNQVIGVNNTLPWYLPADLKHFKALTTGKPIIMGRKTWESLGRALPNRLNIVISRQAGFTAEGGEVFADLDEAIKRANQWAVSQAVDEVILIGGAQLYKQALQSSCVDRLYLTRVHLSPVGDAFFPDMDFAQWQKVSSTDFEAEGDKPSYTIETWDKLI